MSRSTSYIGLTKEAKDFLHKNAKTQTKIFNNGYGECTIVEPVAIPIGKCGMFDECPVNKYELKDNTWAQEFIQAEPWSSGPIVFIGLKTTTKEFLHTEEYIYSQI